MIKLGANKVVAEIQSVLDSKIGKGLFFYESGGGEFVYGLTFNFMPGKLIDRL
jgi:hypothetical protein